MWGFSLIVAVVVLALVAYFVAMQAVHRRGERWLNGGQYAQAVAAYTWALRMNPRDAIAYQNRGKAKHELGDFPGALKDYDAAIRINGDLDSAYVDRGWTKFSSGGDVVGGLLDCTKAIHLNPESAAAYNTRGVIKHQQGDTHGAITDFTRAIELQNHHSPYAPYFNRASVYYARDEIENALDDCNTAIQLAPQSATLYASRGLMHFKQGDLQSALDDCTHALDLDPQDATAYMLRGALYHRQGKHDDAVNDYSVLVDMFPENFAYYNNRGEAYFAAERYEQAKADFQKAADLNPDFEHAVAGLAITQQALGNQAEATRLWRSLMGEDKRFRDIDYVQSYLGWTDTLIAQAQSLIALVNQPHVTKPT